MRGAWVDELERWLPSLPAARIRLVRGRADVESAAAADGAIVVCTYGLCTDGSAAAASLQPRSGGRSFGVVVVDESHALKGRTSQRTKALLPVMAAAKRLLLLSGKRRARPAQRRAQPRPPPAADVPRARPSARPGRHARARAP